MQLELGFEHTVLNLLAHEPLIRSGAFLGILSLMAMWESIAPRRALTLPRGPRWANNLGLVFLNTFIVRALFPTAAVGVAMQAAQQGWGLLNQGGLSEGARILIGVIALDLAIYLQHVLFHAVPVLWRLHRMHHADLDFDVTTGARFHPIEIVLSMVIKLAAIIALGPPAIAVLLFEVLLNATSMFNHSNARLLLGIDRVLRWFVVTPDMHRVHHSVLSQEANSNFGFNLSLWDRLLGTYRAQPSAGHLRMTIGIHDYRNPSQVDRLDGMLTLPFKGQVSEYAINNRSPSVDARHPK